jgi:simple sugar transport system permease protein
MLGVQFRLINSFGATNFGFDGIAIALIGQMNPWGILVASLGFGFLRSGAGTMQRLTQIPTSVVDLVEALIIFFVVCDFLGRLVAGRRREAGERRP